MLLLPSVVLLLVFLLFANAARSLVLVHNHIYIHTFMRVFPLDFIYMVNEERERSRRRERTATIRFVLFTYVYFSCMLSVG